MRTLIIAGVPQSVYLRNKTFQPEVLGWHVRLCNSRDGRASIRGSLAELLRMADESDDEGSHILAFHSREEERGELFEKFSGFHRLCWLEKALLGTYGQPEFNESIRRLADFELSWRSELRPKDVKAALVLPQSSFVPDREVKDLWHRAQTVSTRKDEIAAVVRLNQLFQSVHWKGTHWLDRGGRRFGFDGPRHALATQPNRRWKYTYKTPGDFHYDVSHEDGGAFTIRDSEGTAWRFSQYTNCDCHGSLRSGR